MTEVVHHRCNACSADFGTLGFHGFDRASRSGELLVTCKPCRELFVGSFAEGKWSTAGCPRCSGALAVSDGRCPKCQAPALVFEDVTLRRAAPDLPAYWRPVVDRAAEAAALGIPASSDPSRSTLEKSEPQRQ